MKEKILIPADVPENVHHEYQKNFATITGGTDHIFLFAGDQKLEHLNADFHGPNIHADAQDPKHLFEIASRSRIGAFATHLGLIARYAKQYDNVNYLVKLNGKTDCIATSQSDPISTTLWTVDDVMNLKESSGLSICGVGYTIYLGSTHEPAMLEQAAQMIFQAHSYGLIAGLWIYPRGASIKNDSDPKLLTGAAGIAASLGADFVKIKPSNNMDDLQIAVAAAGNTKVICSGGPLQGSEQFLKTVSDQVHNGHVSGCAIGRNIFQKSLSEAIAFTNTIASIIFDGKKIE